MVEQAEATHEQPLTLSAAQAEVQRWQSMLTKLDDMEQRLVSEQVRLKKERFNAFAAEQRPKVSELNTLLATVQGEISALPDLRSEAEARLTEAKRLAKGVAVVEMDTMLKSLDAQVREAQDKALATRTDEDIEHLLDVFKQAYSLAQDLFSLTGNAQYQRDFHVELLGGDSLAVRQRLLVLQRPGVRKGLSQRPWSELQRIATAA